MPEETSPETAVEQTSPDAGGQEPSPQGESPESPEESLSQEQIQRWKALEEQAEKQNVDLENLLPEFTRTRQRAKELEEETTQWRSHFQTVQHQAQQTQMQQDPRAGLTQGIVDAEAVGDYEKASRLRTELVGIETREVAQQEFARLNETQQQQTIRTGMLESAKKYGFHTQREFDDAVAKATQDPEALAVAVAWARDPKATRDTLLADERERERIAAEAGSTRSIAGSGGRMVPGALESQEQAPVKVPASVYYAFPEAVAKRKWPNAEIVTGTE